MKIIVTSCLAGLLVTVSAQAQGTFFQNLNFEQANPVFIGDPNQPWLVASASALPFWIVDYGNVPQTEIWYNAISTGATVVSVVNAANPFVSAIDGNYSVVLQAHAPGSVASISQTGLIPAGTQSLLFEAQGGSGAIMNILIGTQIIPFAAVGSGPNYTLYGADISSWADETEQITFSAVGGTPNYWNIDDIAFSPNAVPEPNIVALTAMGGLLFGARKWLAPR